MTKARYGMNIFDRQSGSKEWPSQDPNDSSCDKFTCEKCGEVIYAQMYGSLPIGQESFEATAERTLSQHLCIKKRKKK